MGVPIGKSKYTSASKVDWADLGLPEFDEREGIGSSSSSCLVPTKSFDHTALAELP